MQILSRSETKRPRKKAKKVRRKEGTHAYHGDETVEQRKKTKSENLGRILSTGRRNLSRPLNMEDGRKALLLLGNHRKPWRRRKSDCCRSRFPHAAKTGYRNARDSRKLGSRRKRCVHPPKQTGPRSKTLCSERDLEKRENGSTFQPPSRSISV